MFFSERKKLEKEYYNWLDKNKNVKPCAFNVISFLSINGNLIRKEDHNKIEILEKALELVCVDLLCQIYPNRDFTNYKPKTTIKRYKQMAEKIIGGGGNV